MSRVWAMEQQEEKIHRDILPAIFSYMAPEDLREGLKVSRSWHQIISSPDKDVLLWGPIFMTLVGPFGNSIKSDSITFKDMSCRIMSDKKTANHVMNIACWPDEDIIEALEQFHEIEQILVRNLTVVAISNIEKLQIKTVLELASFFITNIWVNFESTHGDATSHNKLTDIKFPYYKIHDTIFNNLLWAYLLVTIKNNSWNKGLPVKSAARKNQDSNCSNYSAKAIELLSEAGADKYIFFGGDKWKFRALQSLAFIAHDSNQLKYFMPVYNDALTARSLDISIDELMAYISSQIWDKPEYTNNIYVNFFEQIMKAAYESIPK